MIDFDGLVFAVTHSTFGATAVITPSSSASPATVEVIDRTQGVAVVLKGADVETVHPVVVVRASVLADAGLTRSDLLRATLAVNGRTYRVHASQPRPTPNGEADGEIWLILTEL